MKDASECPTPRDTTKGFGSYTPWNEPEMQHYFAMDVLRVVKGFLESAGSTDRRDVLREEIYAAGALLDGAVEVLERQGFPAWEETQAQLAQLKANKAAARKRREADGA